MRQTLTEPTLTSRSDQLPLLQMTTPTPTVLWNDSADPAGLTEALTWGCVDATSNPVIGYNTIKKHPEIWAPRIREIASSQPGEAEIGWQAVKDMPSRPLRRRAHRHRRCPEVRRFPGTCQ